MSATTATTSPVRMTVARYLELQISRSDKKQSQMAKELGFDHPNIITMLKQGKTKVPYRRIGPIAKVLDADPAYLLRLVVSEKEPELLEVIEDAMDRDIYTASEKKLISIIRDAGLGHEVVPRTEAQEAALRALVSSWITSAVA